MTVQLQRVLWEVDVQRDFMLPGGALYVPGAEKLVPNIGKLVDLSRSGTAFVISSADQHAPDDPEFKTFPPHCVRATPGGELLPEASAANILRIPNEPTFSLPEDVFRYPQVLLEKQALDVFTNPNTNKLLERLPRDADFFVFGVVTEYCVQCAAKGLLDRRRRVAIVCDAIETLEKGAGDRTVADLASRGARLVSTAQAVAEIQNARHTLNRGAAD